MSARGIAKKRQKNVSKSQRANVLFPVGRLHRYMKAGPGTRRLRIGVGAPVYAAAVIEYLTGRAWAVQVTPPGPSAPLARAWRPLSHFTLSHYYYVYCILLHKTRPPPRLWQGSRVWQH